MNNLLLVLILLASALFLGFDIWSYPLISPDEPRYAETAREMIERADYITPYCDYLPRFDKPVLFYWFEVLSFKLFGVNELAARLPSVLAGTAMVWLAFMLGNLRGYGVVAAAMMLTSVSTFIVSKLSITDMVLTFFISAALAFFYMGYEDCHQARDKFAFKENLSSHWFILVFLMMGLGMLCKGPVAVILPALIIFIFLWLEKNLINFISSIWLDLLIGSGVFLAISLPWYISVHLATDGEFTREFFIGHNLNRFLEVHTGHAGSLWYYIPVIVVGLLPWSFFMLQALFSNDFSKQFNPRSESARSAQLMWYCTVWAVVVMIFFTLSKTKLPTYIGPIYLPLIIIIAKWWSDKFKTVKSQIDKNLDGLIGLGLLLLTVLAAALLSLFVYKDKIIAMHSKALFLPIGLISFILIAAAAIAMTAVLYRARIAFVFITVAMVISQLIAVHFIMKPFAEFRDGGSKAWLQSLDPQDQLVSYKAHNSRFTFYAARPVPKIGSRKLYKYLSSEGENKYFITRPKFIDGFKKFIETKVDPKPEGDLYQVIKQNTIYIYAKDIFPPAA